LKREGREKQIGGGKFIVYRSDGGWPPKRKSGISPRQTNGGKTK